MRQTKKLYEIMIAILAFVSIFLVICDYLNIIKLNQDPWSILDMGILIIFTFDYVIRLWHSKNRWYFFKTHLLDLLAILPFDTIFSFFRLARLFRVARVLRLTKAIRFVRLIGLVGKLHENTTKFLKTNGLIYLIWISLFTLIVASALYSFAEKVNLGESFWWAISTATTVGYGDISPHTVIGKFAAIMLMFVGIGMIGLLTSSITTFFTQNDEAKDQRLDRILSKLNELEQENQALHTELHELKKKV